MVAITSGSTPCRIIGSTISFLKARPSDDDRDDAADRERRPERQAEVPMPMSTKNAGSMTNSPWAKLMVCEVCQSSVKPIATSA